MFKILRNDGLFSKGGCNPDFTKVGKTWRTLGNIRSHINQVQDLDVYNNCELVEYNHYVKSQVDLPAFIAECDDRRKRNILVEELHAKLDKARRKLEYEHLRKEFG